MTSLSDEYGQGRWARRSSLYRVARDSLDSLGTYAAQVEDHEREGDLGALLAADAVAKSILAVAEAVAEAIAVASADAS